jgi:hypothetical protein
MFFEMKKKFLRSYIKFVTDHDILRKIPPLTSIHLATRAQSLRVVRLS